MIKIKPACRSYKLPLEFIFLDIPLFYFIIQIILMDCDHWLFNTIQRSTSVFNLLTWCKVLIWWYWFLWQWADNIGLHDYFVLDIIQQTYWFQTQVQYLIVQSTFKAFLSSDVVNFISNLPRPGLGKSFSLTGYISGFK